MDLDWSVDDNRRFRSSRKYRAADEAYGAAEECLFVQDGSTDAYRQRALGSNPNHDDRAKVIGGKKFFSFCYIWGFLYLYLFT